MPNTWAPADRLRFEELLPFFVTGHLSGADQSFMQTFISANPSARQSLNFALELGRIIRHTGVMRNPNITLNRLLASFKAMHQSGGGLKGKAGNLKSKKTLPILFAIVILGGQAVYYAKDKIDWKQSHGSASVQEQSRVAISLKLSTDTSAISTLAANYGGKIVHTTSVDGTRKVFVELKDNGKIDAFVQALAASGLVESAAILY